MKNIITTLLFILTVSVVFVNAQSNDPHGSNDDLQWIQSLLSKDGITLNRYDEYIFYSSGHGRINWSLIRSDSTGIHLYTRPPEKEIDYENPSIPDSLSFINNNIKTITWGLDSSANAASMLVPIKDAPYNPSSDRVRVIKDGKVVFDYDFRKQRYTGSDSKYLDKLPLLMFWLAAPELWKYIPIVPSDSLPQSK